MAESERLDTDQVMVTVRMSRGERDRWRRLAYAHGVNVSEMIRRAVGRLERERVEVPVLPVREQRAREAGLAAVRERVAARAADVGKPCRHGLMSCRSCGTGRWS